MLAESTTTRPETIRIKGFAVRGLFKFIKKSGYAGGIEGLLATLDDEDRTLFDQKILSSSWYPYETFTVLLEAIDRELGEGDGSYLERVGEFSGSQDAGTIFKVVLTLASIERVISVTPPFWKRYCDHGWFEPLEVKNGRLEIRLREFPQIHPGHCRLIGGWIQGLGISAGARNARVEQTACVHRGDPHCFFSATWD